MNGSAFKRRRRTVLVPVKLPDDMYYDVNYAAAAMGLSRSELIRLAIREYLKTLSKELKEVGNTGGVSTAEGVTVDADNTPKTLGKNTVEAVSCRPVELEEKTYPNEDTLFAIVRAVTGCRVKETYRSRRYAGAVRKVTMRCRDAFNVVVIYAVGDDGKASVLAVLKCPKNRRVRI